MTTHTQTPTTTNPTSDELRQIAVAATEASVSHPAFRLLIHMALHAGVHSDPVGGRQAPVYSHGRPHLTLGLGYTHPAAATQPAQRAVERALQELNRRGLIRRLRLTLTDQSTRYVITAGQDDSTAADAL